MSLTAEDQLAGALAHQLKQPCAALQAAAGNLRRNLRGLFEDLAGATGVSSPPGEMAAFLSKVVGESAPPPITGMIPRDRLGVMTRRLAAAGIDGDVGATASNLVRGGWDIYLDETIPLLRRNQPLAMEILETASRVRGNLTSIEASLVRLREAASALRLLACPVAQTRSEILPGLEDTAAWLKTTLPPGVRLVTRFEPMPQVAGPAELMKEVWVNLAVNAAQAVGDHGRIAIEGTGQHDAAPRAVVRVVDDGPGISPTALPHIFEPLFTTRGSQGGSGIGLALARRIVEKLNGRISAESRPGRTCFEVVLPAVQGRD